jgi:hypothetical protein
MKLLRLFSLANVFFTSLQQSGMNFLYLTSHERIHGLVNFFFILDFYCNAGFFENIFDVAEVKGIPPTVR